MFLSQRWPDLVDWWSWAPGPESSWSQMWQGLASPCKLVMVIFIPIIHNAMSTILIIHLIKVCHRSKSVILTWTGVSISCSLLLGRRVRGAGTGLFP